ncbi:hypothetical protein LWI28_005301 [Acer negundo]|uniref:Uncharacterized protein n=1 Tax=Acer negundo TaxID=4023 RepID=A0AAD5NUV4_ACENE|nr:hypothetical protein LWI28_005301 [Acer negundo]
MIKEEESGKLHISVATMSIAGMTMTPRESRREEIEQEGEQSHSVYCRFSLSRSTSKVINMINFRPRFSSIIGC